MGFILGTTDIRATKSRAVLRALGTAFLAAALGGWHTGALAQAYPSRPVRMIVPFSPGAAVDVVGRVVANGLSVQWGNAVVVENRPGGNSVIGAELVVRAEPDGYTLLFTSDDIFTIVPHLSKLAIDPMKDLVPVNLVAKILMLIVVNAAVPVDSLPALIAYARANPKALSYSSSGSGSSTQLAMETLKSLAKVDILHVPYKGIAPALAAAASGEVQITMSGYGTARGMIDAGRLRPLAVAAPSERVAELPSVPTTGELGYGDVEYQVQLGVAAPGKTPAEIVNRINEAISRALNNPETRKHLIESRVAIADVGPKAFAEQLARKSRLNAEAMRRAGARAD